jgi:hypothetical protein
MILLDTDHATVLKYPASERCNRLMKRLEAAAAAEAIGRMADRFIRPQTDADESSLPVHPE